MKQKEKPYQSPLLKLWSWSSRQMICQTSSRPLTSNEIPEYELVEW